MQPCYARSGEFRSDVDSGHRQRPRSPPWTCKGTVGHSRLLRLLPRNGGTYPLRRSRIGHGGAAKSIPKKGQGEEAKTRSGGDQRTVRRTALTASLWPRPAAEDTTRHERTS